MTPELQEKSKKQTLSSLLLLLCLLNLSAFGLLAFRSGDGIDFLSIGVGLLLCVLIALHYRVLTWIFRAVDQPLLMIVYTLCSIGMIMQYRLSAQRALYQLLWVALGLSLMCVTMVLMRHPSFWSSPLWCRIFMGLSLLLLLAVLVLGRVTGGAKNWIQLGESISIQPSEFVKILLCFILASWLSRRQQFSQLLPLGIFVAALMGILVLSKDLGAAVLYGGTAIALYYISSGNALVTLGCMGAVGVGGVAAYQLFGHVRSRFAAWRNPWASYQTNGYQIAQGLMAIASGGLFGMGLTRGVPKVIPAYHTDYIFAVICEEMGILAGLIVIGLYVLLMCRGFAASRSSSSAFNALLAAGCTVLLALQTFLIIGGVVKFIPLTGVTLPFVSYGGSSMLSSFILLGVLQSVAVSNARQTGGEE
jgi:cell division protein FtsW (lipid II flippase)